MNAGTPLLNGFIKIEKQNAAGVWSDVTLELLNLGFAGPNQGRATLCGDPTPNAVIRLQRFRDNGLTGGQLRRRSGHHLPAVPRPLPTTCR